jgi:hypothetical protein
MDGLNRKSTKRSVIELPTNSDALALPALPEMSTHKSPSLSTANTVANEQTLVPPQPQEPSHAMLQPYFDPAMELGQLEEKLSRLQGR